MLPVFLAIDRFNVARVFLFRVRDRAALALRDCIYFDFSDILLDAIEALKYQLTKQDIPNAGGWLNKAIKEGWTKPEVVTQQSTKPEQKIVTASDKPEKKLVDPNKLKKLSKIFNKKND